MSLASVGYREVEDIVSKWTTKYQYHIHMLESKPKDVRYSSRYADSW